MKRELTQAEKDLIQVFYEKHLAAMTDQPTLEECIPAVHDLWAKLGGPANPEVIHCDSPLQCRKQAKADGMDTSKMYEYWSLWLSSYAALYDFSDNIGIELDQDKLKECLSWSRHCPYIYFNDDKVYLSKRPTDLFYDDDRRLHNEEGIACGFADGWGVYSINGVHLDKQIVMEPETQNVQQIIDEENEEIKRIRIERFGTGKFLREIKAVVIDKRDNDVEATKEFLLSTDHEMRFLMTFCPSTKKDFYLEVPEETKTCIEAQRYLSSGLSDKVIMAS